MRTDVPMLNRITLSALALVLAGVALAAAVSLCGCGGDLGCLPDLRIESVSVEQPATPLEPAAVEVVVWNRGVARAGPFRVMLSSEGAAWYEWRVPGVGPRESRSLIGWVIFSDSSELSDSDVVVVADADDDVPEGCETNNSMTVVVIVGALGEVTP